MKEICEQDIAPVTVKAGTIKMGEAFRRPSGTHIYIRINFRNCKGIQDLPHEVCGADLSNGNVYAWHKDDSVIPVDAVWAKQKD